MQLVLDKKFDDLDELIDEVRDWDLDFRLLQVGGFNGHIVQSVSPTVQLGYASFNSSLNQFGSTPKGYRTFVIQEGGCTDFWWLGYNVTNTCLLVFSEARELASVSFGNFGVYTVSVENSYLAEMLRDMRLPSFRRDSHLIQIDETTACRLRTSARRVLQSGSQIEQKHLVETLVSCREHDQKCKPDSLRMRDRAVMCVIEYLREVPEAEMHITDMCRLARVSERTLQYAFKERYGIPPNVFIKRWKLNTIRKLLLHADPAEHTIGDIADSMGFHHQSQFTADYRKLFTELPSRALIKNK